MAPFQRKYHKSMVNKKPESIYGQVRAQIDFRKAINLIEEYKLKFGAYPENLKHPKFQELINKKDRLIDCKVKCFKLKNGYELNLNSQEKHQLEFSLDFWKGLGITKTNVRGLQESSPQDRN
jgi:hypothetical protein